MKWMQKFLFLIFACSMAAMLAHAQDSLPLTEKFTAVNKPWLSYDRFIVTYRKGSAQRQNRTAALQTFQTALHRSLPHAKPRSRLANNVQAAYIRKLLVGADVIRTSRKLDRQEANRFMQRLAANPAVQYVEPDAVVYIDPPPVPVKTLAQTASSKTVPQEFPNDPDYEKQAWQFADDPAGIDLTHAWGKAGADGGKGVVVAVLDTGITEHPDLDTSLADDGYDFISESYYSGRLGQPNDSRVPGGWDTGDWSNTEPWLSQCLDDETGKPVDLPSDWHGTHVAGTIAELTNNGIDGAGVAYNARILPIRARGHCGGLESDAVDAIVWAAGVPRVDYSAAGVPPNKYPAGVINISFGFYEHCGPFGVMQEAISLATKQGAVVVTAAGNEDQNVDNISPASCQGVITVAATDSLGRRAFYSNYGKDVTLAAPGGGMLDISTNPPQYSYVWSTMNDGKTVRGNPSFEGSVGTSMAAPHVTGVVALMIAARQAAHLPRMTPAAIKQILEKAASARKFPYPDPQKPIGAGILNAYLSVCLAGVC